MKCYEKNYQFHFKDLSEIINNILNVLDINFKKRNYKNLNGKTIYNLINNLPDDDIVDFFES
ncbi:hypothetical protein, partial [uncultured Akkermansia sp.]